MNSKQKQQDYRNIYKEAMEKSWHGNKSMVDYCVKKISRFVELENGIIVTIEKPSIKKDFCFGYSLSRYDTKDYDEANDMALHASKNEEYFIEQNLQDLAEKLSYLKGQGENPYLSAYVYMDKDSLFTTLGICRISRLIGDTGRYYKDFTEVERTRLIEAYEIEIESFKKRLATYLKRYGLSKVNTWSFWRDE